MARPSAHTWGRDFSIPLQAIQSELTKLLEDYWNPSRHGPAAAAPTDLETAGWSPQSDLIETPQAIIVLVEVPGVDPSSIDLSVTGNILSIRGTKVDDTLTEGHRPLRERQFGTFHRQIVLPSEVEFESARAEARNGVLRVQLPKRQAAQPRTIPVQHN